MKGWVASLPMYDLTEVRQLTDGLWNVIARHIRKEGLADTPQALVHEQPVRDLWADKNLLFSQCCGYDIFHRYKRELCVLGTPTYSAPGCHESDYASVVIVPEGSNFDDVLKMPGTVAVINGWESHSGANSLFGLVAPKQPHKRFFSRIIASGSHVASLDLLRRRKADVGAIDCVTYSLLQRFRPNALTGTRRLGLTYTAPAPPFVTRASLPGEQLDRLRTALHNAFSDTDFNTIARDLLLTGLAPHLSVDYARIDSEFSGPR